MGDEYAEDLKLAQMGDFDSDSQMGRWQKLARERVAIRQQMATVFAEPRKEPRDADYKPPLLRLPKVTEAGGGDSVILSRMNQ